MRLLILDISKQIYIINKTNKSNHFFKETNQNKKTIIFYKIKTKVKNKIKKKLYKYINEVIGRRKVGLQ